MTQLTADAQYSGERGGAWATAWPPWGGRRHAPGASVCIRPRNLSIVPRIPVLAAASGVLLAAVMTGCTSSGDSAPIGATPIASPEVANMQPTPEAEAGSAEESEPDAAVVLDCTNLLMEDEYAALNERGLEHRPGAASYPPPAGADLVADGALECLWAPPQGDDHVWIARLVEPDESWSARVAELAVAGWTAGDGPLPGALVRYPEWDKDLQPAIARDGGVTYFGLPGRILRSVAAIDDGLGS